MATLPNRPDFSLYYRRDTPLQIPNVTLVIDGIKLECNGPILAQSSDVLADLFANNQDKELYLDKFTGMIEQVKDCLQLLYGDEIKITLDNLQTLLMFSVLYKIEGMYNLCVNWVKDNLTLYKFEGFFKICYSVSLLEEGRTHALDICRDIILEGKPSENVKVLSALTFEEDQADPMLFFLDPALWRWTLPMVTNWMDTNEKVDLVLKKLASAPAEYITIESDFLSKLASTASANETVIKVNQFVTQIVKEKERLIKALEDAQASSDKVVKKMKYDDEAMKSKVETFEQQNVTARSEVINALNEIESFRRNAGGRKYYTSDSVERAMKTLQNQFKILSKKSTEEYEFY